MHVRWPFARVGGLSLLLALVLLCLVQCNRPPSAPLVLPQKQIVVSEQAANEFLEHLDQALQSEKAFSILVTDEELTSYLRIYLADASLHNPTILITPQGLYASAAVGSQVQHSVHVLFTVQASRGTLHLAMVRATVDGHAVPGLVRKCVEQVVDAILSDMAWPVQIEQATLAEGEMTLRGALRVPRTR